MKYLKRIFLSLLWLFIPSAIVVLLSYQGITLGAIFMVLLHAPFLYLLSLTWHGKFEAEKLPSAIPSDETMDGSISENSSPESPVEPKKPIFERYDTYIACPGCGSLVPKGTNQCACGYDLSSPAARIVRRLRRAVPILLCLLFIIAGTAIGYYAGQKSMESELKEQYVLGYDFGLDAGSKIGYYDGYSVGKQEGYDAGYSAAKMDHSKPNLFSSSSDPSMPRLSGGKLVPIE